MASDPPTPFTDVINFHDYVPEYLGYNSVVYVHKNHSKLKQKESKPKKDKKENKEKQEKVKKKKDNVEKEDKGQQFNGDVIITELQNGRHYNNPIMEHTIRFAKNLIPVTIPPSRDKSPPSAYYTVHACHKAKKKESKSCEKTEKVNECYKKEKCKKIIETFRNEKSIRESLSAKETISCASRNNTLDEIHLNPSFCSSSDISDKKHKKEHQHKKHGDYLKFVASDSFEAIATDMINATTEPKIKIHLMNESDKVLFSENIKTPVIHAMKECISEITSQYESKYSELFTVQKDITCNSNKLDNVLVRLSCIEDKIDKLSKYIRERDFNKEREAKAERDAKLERNAKIERQARCERDARITISPQAPKVRSALERLEEDLVDEKQNSSDEDSFEERILERQKARAKTSAVFHVKPTKSTDEIEKRDSLACGEEGAPLNVSVPSQLGARPNRIPARFCWTDAGRKS